MVEARALRTKSKKKMTDVWLGSFKNGDPLKTKHWLSPGRCSDLYLPQGMKFTAHQNVFLKLEEACPRRLLRGEAFGKTQSHFGITLYSFVFSQSTIIRFTPCAM